MITVEIAIRRMIAIGITTPRMIERLVPVSTEGGGKEGGKERGREGEGKERGRRVRGREKERERGMEGR